MNALVKSEPDAGQVAVHIQSNPMAPRSMNDAIRLADLMCQGKMVPAHLQNSPGDCLMVIEQAMRWNMSPFAVAQCTSSINGKLMFEGKLVAAAVENSGAISGLMDYAFTNSGNERTVTVSATRRGETEPRVVDVVFKDVVTTNAMWKKQPDQQLVYSGARVWARRWTPGVMLGVYTPEEFSAEAQNAEVTREQPRELKAASVAISGPSEKTVQTVDALVNLIESCESPEEWLERDGKSAVYRSKLKDAHPELHKRVQNAYDDARTRLFPDPEVDTQHDPETGELEPHDLDATFCAALIEQFQHVKSVTELSASRDKATIARLKKIEADKPDLVEQVKAAYAQREADFLPLVS